MNAERRDPGDHRHRACEQRRIALTATAAWPRAQPIICCTSPTESLVAGLAGTAEGWRDWLRAWEDFRIADLEA
jgi:hypothetical protein